MALHVFNAVWLGRWVSQRKAHPGAVSEGWCSTQSLPRPPLPSSLGTWGCGWVRTEGHGPCVPSPGLRPGYRAKEVGMTPLPQWTYNQHIRW